MFAKQRLITGIVQAGGSSESVLSPTPVPSHGLISAPIGQAIHRLLLIQAFRPDRLLAMAHVFVSTNLGESFMSIMEQPLDLTHIVDTEVHPAPLAPTTASPGPRVLQSQSRAVLFSLLADTCCVLGRSA